MKPLTLYTNPNSRGRIVRWLLEELNVPYDIKVLQYGDEIKAADYLALNSMGKVPAITHGEVVVTETAAICAYLADQFADRQLAPALDSAERGTYYRWLFFAAGPLEMATSAKAFNWRLDADNAQSVGCGLYQDTLNTLESALTQSLYICGQQFTAADVYVGSHIHWGLMFNTLESRPAFTEYVQRLQARKAAIRANELDDALLTT
ncbi:glutathione S-transferase family protein [Rheinheimera baltica]|uniref:glutathione S-transferase family protein n=1 Tax=Rheinheimera baltica TaxID=67576 RepID=UPI00273F37FC|nr:glutathione S-transferase family protein [Rheinheimera baltica]MDP5144103.1 glutathione S-transferase family protein [Rheinheimera baltica]MDP5148923.1 glutathione S-transferase family protein [Rheinheimera baltica]MDP5189886.1 glutathione S-transferase family protein [Rheinheimera baltica]